MFQKGMLKSEVYVERIGQFVEDVDVKWALKVKNSTSNQSLKHGLVSIKKESEKGLIGLDLTKYTAEDEFEIELYDPSGSYHLGEKHFAIISKVGKYSKVLENNLQF